MQIAAIISSVGPICFEFEAFLDFARISERWTGRLLEAWGEHTYLRYVGPKKAGWGGEGGHDPSLRSKI